MKALSTLLAVFVVSCGTLAVAQTQPTKGKFPHSTGLLPSPYYYPVAPGYGWYHASTAAEGYARGKAAMIQAQGQYNLMTAAARNLAAEAHQQEIVNRKERIENYFAMRETNRAARSAEYGKRAPVQVTSSTAAKRLGPDELDRQTGEISWPELLRSEPFAASREQLEQLFADRAAATASPDGFRAQVRAAAGAMLEELKNHIAEVSPSEYMTARRFVERLAYEAHRLG